MHGARRGTRPAEESGDVHRAWGECTGRHNAGAGADERHRGLHRHGAGEGSLQSEDGGASAAHIHPGHSSPAGVEWGTAPGSGRAGCIHEGRGTSGRIHLWEDSSAEGNGIGRGHAGPGHQGFGSKRRHEDGGVSSSLGAERSLTSATQVTREPLNSRPSSFSMAVFKSFAVSYSTNLEREKSGVNGILAPLQDVRSSPTLCRLHGRSRSRPRLVRIDEQNL